MPQPSLRPDWYEKGRKDGRYVLGPLLGHGGMGDVVEAWDTILGRVVALKILNHAEPAAMVRFMHEAQLQAKLEHPNICRIYDIEAHEGVPRIAMQLVRGPTLEDATNDLELEEIVALIAQVAETLEDAHRHGLIHRDIKPGNVILEPLPGGGWKPILCDFGLALHVDASVLTLPNALTGTPAYMAPEQVRGDRRHIGPATDVYALGGTLYFLLVGRPPCVSTVTQEMLKVKKERRFPTPRALEPSIPEALEAILLRCLAPVPADRYPTMEALAADLWGFLGRAPRRSARKWRSLAATAAALGLVAGLGGLAWQRAASQERSAERFNRAAQEASNLLAGLRYEQEQPLHDTRSALARIRAVRDATAAPADDPAWALVRGTADYCLDDLPSARAELEKAIARGPALPGTAYLLGIVCARQWLELEQQPAQRGQAAGRWPSPVRRGPRGGRP
ncbi:MAG: serine/threonine protein kinase, partial [Holophaga sp.]|nr:serine/threonine protein kinase [Holophaga sp.]